MIVVVAMAAGLITGMFLGWLLAAIYTHAAISRSQQRMQRIVRYWQDEAVRLGAEVERLIGSPLPEAPTAYLDPRGG